MGYEVLQQLLSGVAQMTYVELPFFPLCVSFLCGSSEALRAGVLNSWRYIRTSLNMCNVFCAPGPEAGPRAAEPQRWKRGSSAE